MPAKILDLEFQAGRVVDNKEIIDDKKPFTIKIPGKSEIVDWYLTT